MAARRTNKNEPRVGANELNERKRKVLWAVVQDYADTAEPVGSRTIAKKYNLGVSSATIRNEMQDLEDEGYLEQPHTSAGRIPSIKGYRFYVDWLMQPAPVSSEEKSMIDSMLLDHVTKVDEIFRNMAKAVSSLTHNLSVATSAGIKKKFNYIRFLPLDGERAILLVVTDRGDVSNAVVEIPKGSTFDEMQLLADRMNHFLHGRDIDSMDEKEILTFQKDIEKNKKIDPKLEAICHDLEEKMKGIFGTKVAINQKDNKKGKIEIEYYSMDELDRIMDLFRTIEK